MPRLSRWTAQASGIAVLALLSACASHHSTLSSGQSTAYYESHAQGAYKPPGPPGDPWGPYIEQASTRFDVPTQWIRQVMRVESGGHEYMGGHLTVSSAGAMGLMQLEPETYQEMAARYGLGNDPFNPYNNIMAGTAYIHEMYEIYGSPGFLAAYNAGPGRLDDYLDYKRPLPDQTRHYVAMIAPNIEGIYPAAQPNLTGSDNVAVAMNALPDNIPAGMRPGYDQSTTDSLNAGQLAAHAQGSAPALQPAPVPPSAPIRMAALTPPPSVERPSYTPPSALSVPPPVPHGGGFSLIPSAEAATRPPMPMPAPQPVVQRPAVQPQPQTRVARLVAPPSWQQAVRARSSAQPVRQPAAQQQTVRAASWDQGTGSRWGIQVGAYDTPAHAKAALGIAELSAVSSLMKGQPVVEAVSTGHGRLYRARFINLPHQQAVQACQRLNGGPTGCSVISPAAG
ncbi:MAG TPA: transglycosylase SLT domain-containing protein [Acidiphilium sp.]